MPSDASKPIFLVGLMGAGKTSVGERLAKRLDRRFVDLDALVEEWAGEPIADLIASGREQEFRELERTVLRGFDSQGAIVATGGGTPTHSSNVDYMLERGRVAYLRTSPSIAAQRVGHDRPLLKDVDPATKLAELLNARSTYYDRAAIAIDTDDQTVDEVVDALAIALELA